MKFPFIKNIIVKAFHTFSKTGKTKDDMVSITLTMPKHVWENVHEYLNVDIKGKPTRPTFYSPGSLIWEQKNRKEKEK